MTGGLFDETLPARWELVCPLEQLAEPCVGKLAPALGNRRHATPSFPAFKGDPPGREARRQGNAEAGIAAAFRTSTVPERGWRTPRDQPTFVGAPLAPDRMDVPGVPEAGLVVAKGTVR
jgi:hypothetical protein